MEVVAQLPLPESKIRDGEVRLLPVFVPQPRLIRLLQTQDSQLCVTTDGGEERERATEGEGPKALQQLWVQAVGLARRSVPWASTKLMKKQQRGNTSAELGPEHRAHGTTAPMPRAFE
ncbi:hypothetical protein EYF80_017091 [Liparis tanakae]|uniref:Uncharacterized protein n=1 Tax=Liparis tanakae TaxID=230148 RepID=A0A4Z2I5U2_9TELE|nr:hypothetical protein EYF80_017091 [Liparis tanakae]